MARLPQTVDNLQAPQGAPVSTAAVAPTDFGLGRAAQAVQVVAEAKTAQDDLTAKGILENAQRAFQPKFAERAAAYDGRSPGFASQQLAAFDDHFTPVADDGSISEGVRSALQGRLANMRTQVGSQALAIEGEKRAGIVADQEKVKRDVRIGQQVIAYNGRFSPAYQARVDAFDGSDPDFAAGVVADHDTAAAQTLAETPDDIKTDVTGLLNAKKVQIAAQALEGQDHGHDAFVVDNARKTVTALTNNVLANPAAYDSTKGDLDHAAAGIPGALRAKFVEEAQSGMVEARIKGLVDKGDLAQAHAELTDHRYDKVLKPGKAETLLAHIDAAQRGGPKTLDDWRRVYEADANIDAEASARAQGQTTGYTLQGASDVLTARMEAEAEQKWKRADQVFAATGNLKAQTNDELRARAIAPAPSHLAAPSLPPAAGQMSAGNLDPWNRPILKNPDGSYSTTSSISVNVDGKEVLIPTVVKGKRLSTPEAVAHYKATGESFGTFDTAAHADAYATELHNRQDAFVQANGGPDKFSGGVDPAYGDKFKAWELSRKAAAGELETRLKDPAAWAMNSTRAGDTGAQLQDRWRAFAGAQTPQEMGAAGRQYAFLQLGLQARGGTSPAALRIFTKDEASQFAQSYAKAPPEQRAQALKALSMTVAALPTGVPMGDGTIVSAAHLAVKELREAGLGTADVSALVDLRDNPGQQALYADATANPAALKALTAKGAETTLKSQVDQRLAPFLATANTLPGSAELNYGRQQRAMIVARHLMETRGLDARTAAQAATGDLAEAYRFTDGWRIPAAVATAPAGFLGDKQGQIRTGAAQALKELTTDGAALAPAPAGPAVTLADRQKLSADHLMHGGRWVTTESDTGLQLMAPDVRGWTPMADKYGRPIRLTWDQAAQLGAGDDPGRKPLSWLAPPPNAGAPATAPPPAAKAAFAQAIEGRESHGHAGAISPKGALGVRQLMPKTAEAAAAALGVAYDPARLLADPAYNRQLSDHVLGDLAARYHGNPALMAAGYNAGPAAVDGWIKRYGDPRDRAVGVDDWVAHIPYPETRAYVRNVLPRAVAILGRGR